GPRARGHGLQEPPHLPGHPARTGRAREAHRLRVRPPLGVGGADRRRRRGARRRPAGAPPRRPRDADRRADPRGDRRARRRPRPRRRPPARTVAPGVRDAGGMRDADAMGAAETLRGAGTTGEAGRMRDFGGIVERSPARVVRPGSAGEVADAVREAAARGLRAVPRGLGHSTHGQSLTDGVSLDLRGLTGTEVRGRRAVAAAGTTWREVLAATLPHGLTPPVLTDYLDLTVGGTISAGGIGGT